MLMYTGVFGDLVEVEENFFNFCMIYNPVK